MISGRVAGREPASAAITRASLRHEAAESGLAHLASGPRATDGGAPGGVLVLSVALGTLMLVAVAVGAVFLVVRRLPGSASAAGLDQAARSLGLSGEQSGLRGRRWRGAWGRHTVALLYTPGSAKAAEQLVLHVSLVAAVGALRIQPAAELIAAVRERALPLPPSLSALVAFGDASTLRRLLGSPPARRSLEALSHAQRDAAVSLEIAQTTLELRVVGPLATARDAAGLRRWLDACVTFGESLR